MTAPSPGAAALAAEIRRRLGRRPELPTWPSVTLVVLNRDGVGHLGRLVGTLTSHTDYPRFDLIVVDNGSSDDSVDFIRRVEAPFPISILANPHNESFSDACNQGAELASGELLLFLNNDTEAFEPGWLRELVACRRRSNAGAVAATLICLEEEHERSFRFGFGVQHRGLEFREEEEMLVPALHGWEADPLDARLGEDIQRGAVAAACMLVDRDAFERVGGFTHGYVYGAEDVDLCLKLRAVERDVVCSGRSIVIHHPVSTRRLAPFEEEQARKLGNRRLLWECWGPRLRREYELDRLVGSGLWSEGAEAGDGSGGESSSMRQRRAETESLGFCLHDAIPGVAMGLEKLAEALRSSGHRTELLQGDRSEGAVGLNYDIAVYVRGASRYIPKPGQLNVLWVAASSPELSETECSRYELIVSESSAALDRLGERGVPSEARAHLAGADTAELAGSLAFAAEARAEETGLCTRVAPAAPVSAAIATP